MRGGCWQRFFGDVRGGVTVFIAIAAAALIGFTALGVETGLWYAIKRQHQSAADAAALSGAYEIAAGQTYSDICGDAKNSAAANSFPFDATYACPNSSPGLTNPTSGTMYVNNPPVGSTTGENGNQNAVEIFLARQQDAYLASLFLPSVTIGTHAVAKVNQVGLTCDLALGKTGTVIDVSGSATLNLTGCGMAANSSDSASIWFHGGSNDILNASWFQTVGNFTSSGNPVINVPTELTDTLPVTDPYSCNPPIIGCAGTITWPMVSGSEITTLTTSLSPGVYQGPMILASGTTTLSPGVYIIDGDDNQGNAFKVGSGATVSGTGVTIIATSKTGNQGGGLDIASGATVNISAPTTSPQTGIPSGLIFAQDPRYADTKKGNSTITANGTTSLAGVVYTPATQVTFIGNANSTCFLVIALTITFTGNSTMAGNQSACTAIGVTAPIVLNIALTE